MTVKHNHFVHRRFMKKLPKNLYVAVSATLNLAKLPVHAYKYNIYMYVKIYN